MNRTQKKRSKAQQLGRSSEDQEIRRTRTLQIVEPWPCLGRAGCQSMASCWPVVPPKVPGKPKRDPSFDNPTKQCKSLKFVKSVNRLQRPRKVNTPRRGVTYNTTTTVCYVCWLVLTLETKIPVRRFLLSLTVTRANNRLGKTESGGPVRADSQTIWGLRECTSR